MSISEPGGESSIATDAAPLLRRVLGTPLLVFYGLGVIIGACIYVLVGSVVKQPRSPLPTLEDDELLSQTQVLRHQQRLRLEERRDRPPHPFYH
jgi:hypothetical protein